MLSEVLSALDFGFIATTLLTLVLFVYAVRRSSYSRLALPILMLLLSWLSLQALLSGNLFYFNTAGNKPPPFTIIGVFPFILACVLPFVTKKGRAFIDGLPQDWLTLLSIVRIPVELVLFGLYGLAAIPEEMTFEGHNFDIVMGITAPLVFYFGYRNIKLGKTALIIWNVIGVILLLNIIAHAALAFPTFVQQYAFDQPNVGVLYFPYFWLPSFVAPIVLFSHFAILRQLIRGSGDLA